MRQEATGQSAPNWLIWTALWIVYLVWGSTYLAIRVTVETMPPLLSAGVRFLLAGAIMFAVLAARRGVKAFKVRRAEVLASTAVGSALLLGGNGLVSVAEQYVASALAALIIASVPLWVIVLRFLSRDRVAVGTMFGVAAGFAGVALLVMPGGGSGSESVGYSLLIVLASMSWATGSFFSKRLPLPADPFVSTTMQMLCGGMVMALIAVLRGELIGLEVSQFSGASIAGFVYLVIAGSLLAFTAYVWLLQHAPISKVATYAYVNPVVAIFLGWLILSEQITAVILIGAALIVAAVAAIIRVESMHVAKDADDVPTAAPGALTVHEPELGLVRSPD